MSLFQLSQKKVLFLSSLLVLAQFHVLGWAMEAPPPIETQKTVDQTKLQNAKVLTTWLQNTLYENKALIAVVARRGGNDVKKHDQTGMAHTGLAVYDPRAQTWLIYNLLSTQDKPAKDKLWRTAPLDFFYGQTGYDQDALVLIPDVPTQERVYESILNGNYKKLFFSDRYNLLSPYDTVTTLNCNKWLLFTLVAARIDNYDPQVVSQVVHDGFNPGSIRLSPLEQHFAKQKTNIVATELPKQGAIQTVTVESLYRSNLFPVELFYSGKKLSVQ